ncbi:TetR/AcrR family transcriptional regulator [Gordonia terrae]
MGRIQEFDTTEVVRAARGIFWQRGYENASLPDLERATGIGRSSLYHAFGSKRGLFDAAVQSYLDEVVRPRLRPLTGSTITPDAVEDYLNGLRSSLTDDTSPADVTGGCCRASSAAD